MQIIVEGLVEGLRERGFDVRIAVGRPLVNKKLFDNDHSFPELNMRPANAVRAAWVLRSLLRNTRPDIVHGHGLRLAPVLTLATVALRPVPLVVTCHGIPPEQIPGAARLLKLSRGVIASCGEGPRALLAAEGIHGPLLRNGVPPPPLASDRRRVMESLGLPEEFALVVSPGRLVPQKDHLTAIRTIKHLSAAALVIVGDGPLKAELQAEADILDLAARVRLVGWRSDVRSLIGASDALLLPSRWEGFPLVAIEAMMASVPVVATSSPGLREWLIQEDNALLAPVEDHQQLARALERLFGDAELRARLIIGGNRIAQKHTVTAMLDDHVQLYQDLADMKRR
jgi:glycosyltransferase involved in cell wall biosynthesis